MDNEFGQYIRELRLKKNMSLRDLADESKLSYSFIGSLENGRFKPSRSSIEALAHALGAHEDTLLILAGFFPTNPSNDQLNAFKRRHVILNKDAEKIAGFVAKMRSEDDAKKQESSAEMVKIPVLGTIKAGLNGIADQALVGEEIEEYEDVRDGAYFYLVVKGDSMENAGIRDGMKVLVKQQNWVEPGKIGVVLVDGEEATLKYVTYNEDTVTLHAANVNYPPRPLPISDIRIQGQVKAVKWYI